MHAIKFTGALVLFLATLLSDSPSAKAESEGNDGDVSYQSCPDCNLSCDIKVTLGNEEKNRVSCYNNIDDMVVPLANPRNGWQFHWQDKGTSDMAGRAWHHDRGCDISGVKTENGIFDHNITRNGMTTKITCGSCV